VGDVVYIRSGDKIPADCLLFFANEFKVDNSSLTGEADPQERLTHNEHKNPLEATNLAFNGTLAVNGDGYGIVIRTGDNTVIGQIASLTANEQKRDSPLSNEINHFVHIISYVAALTTIVFLIIAVVVRKFGASAGLNFAIGN
jgi:sodium/potassium-transporting ATPase subunit alpha